MWVFNGRMSEEWFVLVDRCAEGMEVKWSWRNRRQRYLEEHNGLLTVREQSQEGTRSWRRSNWRDGHTQIDCRTGHSSDRRSFRSLNTRRRNRSRSLLLLIISATKRELLCLSMFMDMFNVGHSSQMMWLTPSNVSIVCLQVYTDVLHKKWFSHLVSIIKRTVDQCRFSHVPTLFLVKQTMTELFLRFVLFASRQSSRETRKEMVISVDGPNGHSRMHRVLTAIKTEQRRRWLPSIWFNPWIGFQLLTTKRRRRRWWRWRRDSIVGISLRLAS